MVLAVALASFPVSREGLAILVEAVATEGVGVAVYTPTEYVIAQIYLMLATGIAVAIPVIIYEAYAFMAPGLYPREKRLYLLIVPFSAVLLLLGAALAWLVVIPQLAPVLMTTGDDVVRAAISIERAFFFVAGLMFLMGLVFQVPVALAIAVWSGVVTPASLFENRLYAYTGFFLLTSVLTVDPTMASQLILTAVFVALYELSVRVAELLT